MTHPLRYAGSALAAALALASTASLAQNAAPLPTTPEPLVVVPEILAPGAPEPIMVQQPTVQPLPESPPEANVPPEPREAGPASAAPDRAVPIAERAAPAPQAVAPAEAAAPASIAQPVIAPPVADPVAAAESAAVETPREAARRAGDPAILALVLGGLAILALAIWGFVAIGRRTPVRRYVADRAAPVNAKPAPTAPAVEPVRDAQPAHEVQPLFATYERGALPHAGAAVALPRALPESFDEREALFRRMVDARPDRANPFTDRKARMKRARLIMQSIGRDFGDAEPWIDLSQYPNNWPGLQRRSAAA